jgi:hypothetical protein
MNLRHAAALALVGWYLLAPLGTGPTFRSTPKFEPSTLSSRNSG